MKKLLVLLASATAKIEPWHTSWIRTDESSSPSSTEYASAAVCVAGLTRTFFSPMLQTALAANFHHPGYDYFLSIESSMPLHEAADQMHPSLQPYLRSVSALERDLYDVRSNACPPGTAMDGRLFHMAARLAACHIEITREEKSRGGGPIRMSCESGPIQFTFAKFLGSTTS